MAILRSLNRTATLPALGRTSSPPRWRGALLNSGANTAGTTTVTISVADAAALLPQAVARWNAVLPASKQVDATIQFDVSTVPPASAPEQIADTKFANGIYTITLDDNAAGSGWYIDDFPTEDSEFAGTGPAGIDLLTAIMHEVGHVLAISHPNVADPNNVMNGVLDTGVRVSPTESNGTVGLSPEDKLDAGLAEFKTWAPNLAERVDTYLQAVTTIPFTNTSLADLLDIDFGQFNTSLSPKIQALQDAVGVYFDSTTDPNTNDLLLALQDIPDVTVTTTPGVQQFDVSILLSEYQQAISLELDNLELDLADYGIDFPLPFDFGLNVTQSQPLQLSVDVSLDFSFGIDGSGEFFVLDPSFDASVEFGEIQQQIVEVMPGTEDVSGTAAFVVLGDRSVPAGQVLSGHGQFVAGDNFTVTGSSDNNGSYTVYRDIGDAVVYDVFTDTTTIYVQEDVDSSAADGSLIKTMDFEVTLGPFGLASNDAVISFGAFAGLGFENTLHLTDFRNGRADVLLENADPTIGEGTHYELIMPIEWAGLLEGVNDGIGYIMATSQLVQPGASLSSFLASVPISLQFRDMGELFKFNGISLDMILGTLESLVDDMVGMDRQVIGRHIGGGEFAVYEERWTATGTPLEQTDPAAYTPVLDGTTGEQLAKQVTLEDGTLVRLQRWNDGTNDLWGTRRRATRHAATASLRLQLL